MIYIDVYCQDKPRTQSSHRLPYARENGSISKRPNYRTLPLPYFHVGETISKSKEYKIMLNHQSNDMHFVKGKGQIAIS